MDYHLDYELSSNSHKHHAHIAYFFNWYALLYTMNILEPDRLHNY